MKGYPLHHIGFVTSPYEPSLKPTTTKYQLVCASKAVKQNMIQQVALALLRWCTQEHEEMYGRLANSRSLPELPSPSERRPEDLFQVFK